MNIAAPPAEKSRASSKPAIHDADPSGRNADPSAENAGPSIDAAKQPVADEPQEAPAATSRHTDNPPRTELAKAADRFMSRLNKPVDQTVRPASSTTAATTALTGRTTTAPTAATVTPAAVDPAVDSAAVRPTMNTAQSLVAAPASSVASTVSSALGTAFKSIAPAAPVSIPSTTTRIASPVAPPRPLSPIQAIGGAIINAISTVTRLFTPAPVIPAGSTVTYGRSTLQMPCGCGTRSVNAGWYFPNQDQPPAGVVYLQHGFLDNSANLSALAVHVAQTTNSIVVTPDISSNFFASDGWWLNSTETAQSVADLFTGNREELTASASQAAGHDVSLPQQFVLAGHSAGGGLAVKAASDLVSGGASRGLAGVLMYDGVDFTSQMPQALAKLDGTNIPVLQIAALPSGWNSFGSGAAQLVAARPNQFDGILLLTGVHIDAEGPSAAVGQQLYTGLPLPANIAAVQTLSSTWINDMYTGTPIEGPPGQFTVIGQAPAAALPDVLSGVASILPNLITPVLPAVIGSLQPAAL